MTVVLSLFVTDLDNTLVGDDRALAELHQWLDAQRQTRNTKIVYSTGRSPILYRQLQAEKHLLEPDALVSAVGTEIYHQGQDTPDADWTAKICQGWDRDTIVASAAHFADLVAQPDTEQRPFKVSYYLTPEAAPAVISQLESLLRDRQLAVKLIYSGSQDLDILPRLADKGSAMLFLRQQWGIAPAQTVVCGDSGNDRALFEAGTERGIIVGNAQPELRQWYQEHATQHHYLAQAHCAGGILEGLQHFEFFGD